MKYTELVNSILEQLASTPPPPPPAIVRQVADTQLSFEDIYNFIKEHEGYRPRVYIDTVGKPTVGIGLNLTRPDARTLLSSVGANYDNVLNGTSALTDQQIKEIFKMTLSIAYKDAKKFLPNYDGLPKNIKLAVLDLSFNLGYPGLSKFVKLKAAIEQGNYAAAANEVKNSKWATQVGRRLTSIVNLFLTS